MVYALYRHLRNITYDDDHYLGSVSRGQGSVSRVCVSVRDSVFRFSRPAGNYYSFLEPLEIIVFIINM